MWHCGARPRRQEQTCCGESAKTSCYPWSSNCRTAPTSPRSSTAPTFTTPAADCRYARWSTPIAGHEGAYRLITTILDPDKAPAAELAALYAQRWEFESTLDEIKTHLGGSHLVLRSQHPDGAEQELYGFLLVHHAIRHLMHQAARQADRDPDRISFTRSLRVVRRQVTDQAAFSPRQTRPRDQSHPH
ncbi:transposase [Streptomyces sp. NPDC102274]|uniref:transposase n=1 Tax=Streptomyces sp. NPDC102274 TaxID=3366151 RepID=UPI0037FBC0AE